MWLPMHLISRTELRRLEGQLIHICKLRLTGLSGCLRDEGEGSFAPGQHVEDCIVPEQLGSSFCYTQQCLWKRFVTVLYNRNLSPTNCSGAGHSILKRLLPGRRQTGNCLITIIKTHYLISHWTPICRWRSWDTTCLTLRVGGWGWGDKNILDNTGQGQDVCFQWPQF